VSVEGVDGLYEYIRGGNNFTFAQLNQNLKHYNFDRVIISVTVMAYNIAHLGKIQSWYDNVKQDHWSIYFNNVVAQPAYLNPRILPNSILDAIDYKLPNIDYTQDVLLGKHIDKFVNFTRDLDGIRNTNVLDYCPEFTDLFE
jgi:hypothetical protein